MAEIKSEHRDRRGKQAIRFCPSCSNRVQQIKLNIGFMPWFWCEKCQRTWEIK